jgi:hypothetical protein
VKIRDARDDDLPAVARVAARSDLLVGDLDERAFPAMLSWLYVDAPPGIRLQVVAEHDGAVVAHYGASPIRYKLDGETCLAGFASNLVIDREHRAGMLFLSLQAHLHREYRKRDFRFIYGLITRANVLEPHLRTGWRKIGTIPVYAKPFDFPAAASSAVSSPLLRRLAHVPLRAAEAVWKARWSLAARTTVRVEEVRALGSDAEAFLARFTASHAVTAVRDAQTLDWRFARYRERGYRTFAARRGEEFVGYVVTRIMPMKHLRAMALVDLAFDPQDREAGAALLGRCDAEAIRARVDVAAAIVNPHSPFAAWLRRFGYLRSPEQFTLVVHAPKTMSPPLDETTFARWHVTWFDHDYV